MPSCLHAFVPLCLHPFVPSYLHAFMPSCLHVFLPFVPLCLRVFLPSCLRASVPSCLCAFLISCVLAFFSSSLRLFVLLCIRSIMPSHSLCPIAPSLHLLFTPLPSSVAPPSLLLLFAFTSRLYFSLSLLFQAPMLAHLSTSQYRSLRFFAPSLFLVSVPL